MTRLCPTCGEPLGLYAISKCHACAMGARYVPTPEQQLADCLNEDGAVPVGGIYCPDDESEKVWRREEAERLAQLTQGVDSDWNT